MNIPRRASRLRQQASANGRALIGGYRYAKTLRRSIASAEEIEPGRLERYFDELTEGPGIWKWRHYFDMYERHLSKFVDRGPNVVEVGIFSGGSLPMWHDYFGPGTTVYGIDIEPACMAYEAPDTRVFIGDQADPTFWARFLREVPEFDVVIDDGGHETHQQIATLEAVLPRLAAGGVYICEDVHGPGNAFHAYIDGLSRSLHAMGDYTSFRFPSNAMQAVVDSIHVYPFVTVIEKRQRPIDVLEAPRHGSEWEPFYRDTLERESPELHD